jgi:LysR family transcriptional regulator, nitrogen assimilation regulatory protein
VLLGCCRAAHQPNQSKMLMDLRQLRYFVGIVDEKSISLASQRLHVAQPALSQHVRALETELGVVLLLRGTHGVRPTEAGERLHAYALNILKYVDEAVDQVRRYGSEPRGQVAIGLPTSAALVLAVPLIEAVRRELPDVRLRLSEGMSGHILEWLQIHRLDLAMLFDFARSSSLIAEPLLSEDLYAICPPGTRSDDIPLTEAAALPLIVPGRPHGLRETIEKAARGLGLTLNVTAEIDALPQIKMLVQRGVGSSILSGSAVREEWRGRALEVRRIIEPGLERTVTLCHLKGRPLSGAAEAVREVLLRVIRDLVGRDIWPSRPQPGLTPAA